MTQDNSQNIIMLLLVAVITGFVLPALAKAFEIIFTRRIAKKTELQNKQLEIIDQLIKAIWEWRFLGKQVCYYGCDYKVNEDRFKLAVKNYNDRVWTIFAEIKIIQSRSIVWYPELGIKEIEKLYEYIKSEIDPKLTELMEESENAELDSSDEFNKLQVKFTKEVSFKIEAYIKAIADTISKATT
jgi:hypothetical protein